MCAPLKKMSDRGREGGEYIHEKKEKKTKNQKTKKKGEGKESRVASSRRASCCVVCRCALVYLLLNYGMELTAVGGSALFVAATVGCVVLTKRQSDQSKWNKTYRDKQRVVAEARAAETRAVEEKAAHARHVKATRERQQCRREKRDFSSMNWMTLYDLMASDLCAQFERDYVRGIAVDLIFELDASYLEYAVEELAKKAVEDKQTRPHWLYWQLAFLVCRNTKSARAEIDVLAGLMVAVRNYPGDLVLTARVIRVLAVTWRLVQDMDLTFVTKLQRVVAGSWQLSAEEPHWSAVAWKKAVLVRIKDDWTTFLIGLADDMALGQGDRQHAVDLLANLELDEYGSDCEGECVNGVYLHSKKKARLEEGQQEGDGKYIDDEAIGEAATDHKIGHQVVYKP